MRFFIPTPTRSWVALGPITIHFYALAILSGAVLAIFLTRYRYRQAGGDPEEVSDLALWSIPAGIIGGRLYHVITSPDAYFGAGGHPLNALKIWQGGMGIWGAIALGVIVARLRFSKISKNLSFSQALDAVAPALLIAQGVGRWGNWFNAELFGKPTTLPWGLEIPFGFRPVGYEQFSTYHPTFLYESLWCFAAAALLIYLPYFKKLPAGYLFVAYIALYTAGRTWIEALRIDQAHKILGWRLNVWVSATLLFISVLALIRSGRKPTTPAAS